MNKLLRTLLIISSLFISSLTWAQDYPMLHFTVEDGLPSNTIYNIFRDSKGYLWIATDKGIARYNGFKFEIFTSFDGLADNEVFFFREDGYGRIWMATYNGKLCFYKDGIFHNATNTPFLNVPNKSSYIIGIDVSKDSSVTFAFYDPRVLLNVDKERANYYYLNSSYGSFETVSIHYKKKISTGIYKFIASSDVAIVDVANNTLKQLIHIPISGSLKAAYSQDQFFAYDNDSVYSDDLRGIRKLPSYIFDQYVMVCYSHDNIFFEGTNNGLFINDTIQVLNGCKVSTITNDDKGNYWMGTLNKGLFCMKKDLRSRVYKNYYTGSIKYATSKRNNIFFTTTNNDLYTFKKQGPRKIFDFEKYKKEKYTFPNNEAHFIDDSCNYYSLYNHDLVTIKNILAPHPLPQLYNFTDRRCKEAKSIYPINDSIYVVCRNDLLSINTAGLQTSKPVKISFIKDTAKADRIFGAGEDKNILWFSTINQVFTVDKGKIKTQPELKNISFKFLKISGNYLVGCTQENKLLICKNIEGDVKIDSVPDQNCIWNKIYTLNSNHLLVSTNNFYRLVTLLPDGIRPYSIFTVESPFLPLEVEGICADSSNCYFFKNGEVTSLDINGLYIKPDPVKLFFTALKTDKRSIPIDTTIQIPFYESKNISISFSTLFFSGNQVFYQYSVTKNNTDKWSDLKSEEINLFNLGYGTYTIKVKARSISSEYGAPAVFTLQILRPFWATWWFITLCSCIVIATTVALIRYRIAAVVNKKEKENQTKIVAVKAEYKALNALMNPHFIFNTLNNVQSLVNDNNKMAANEYLRVFADLIRQNMHNVSKELIPLQKEMDLVTNYLLLEKLRFEEKLNYTITIDENLDLSDILVPPLLIQPLVENSIKHGILNLDKDNGRVCVNVYERDEYLFIEVKDNGVGINYAHSKKATAHESFGLDNIRKRIQQLSIIQGKEISFHIDDIIDRQDSTQWTVATISMPFSE